MDSFPSEDTPSEPNKRSRKKTEHVVYGWNACQSVFKQRPDDILRLYFHKERARQVSALKKWCADHRLPYRELDTTALGKAAASVHHEGIVLIAKPLGKKSAYDLIDSDISGNRVWVALDQIENTHNLGAMLRTCAYFGVVGCVLGKNPGQANLTSSAARMAEGAMEHVPVYEGTDLTSVLRDLKQKGAFILGTDPEAKDSLHDVKLKAPCVVVMGNESEGLSSKVKNRCDKLVRIPGEGSLQSINVSVALGVMLSELHRRGLMTPGKRK